MTLNNPDILYPLLEDMSLKIRHLNHQVSYVIDDAERIMHVTIDQTSNATFDTHCIASLHEQDRDKIAYWDSETTHMLNKAKTLMQGVKQLHARLMQVKRACDQSLGYWTSEHHKAVAWLNRAKDRLAHAIHNLDIARNRLRSAEAALSSAQSALNNCRNSYKTDSQGRRIYNNCSGYEQQVTNAQYNVQRAGDECKRWEVEKQNAEIEVAQAEARVNRCAQSLKIVNQAIDSNNKTLNIANEADNYCQRCLEEVKSAAETIVRAKDCSNRQNILVQENSARLNVIHQLSNDAGNNFREAYKRSADVQLYGNLAGEEVDKKVDLLKQFSITPHNL